jgi:DNA-binding transcriptional MerR regulator
VSVTTVRRYAEKYASHLSSYANHQPRTFTETDVARLTAAYRLTSQGVSQEKIEAAIQDLQAGEVLAPDSLVDSLADTSAGNALRPDTGAQLATMAQQEVLTLAVRVEEQRDVLQHQIDAINDRLSRQGSPISPMITGIVVGVAITLIAIAFALWGSPSF